MSQMHSRHLGSSRAKASSWNEKAAILLEPLKKYIALQQNTNWFTLHIIIVFPLSRALRVLTWKPLKAARTKQYFCISSDGRRHHRCNVFGHIISPPKGISFTSLTGFPHMTGVSSGSVRSENSIVYNYMTTSISGILSWQSHKEFTLGLFWKLSS